MLWNVYEKRILLEYKLIALLLHVIITVRLFDSKQLFMEIYLKKNNEKCEHLLLFHNLMLF